MQIDLDLPPDILRNPGSNYLPRKSKKRAPEKDQCNVEFMSGSVRSALHVHYGNVILHTRASARLDVSVRAYTLHNACSLAQTTWQNQHELFLKHE